MRHSHLRFQPRLRLAFYSTFAVLFGTGVGWWILQRTASREDFSSSEKVFSSMLMRVHGGAAMLALLILGVLYPLHIARGWRTRHNRFWGSAVVVASLLLIATGYFLYYLSAEELRAMASSAHTWIGTAFPLIVAIHIARGRASH